MSNKYTTSIATNSPSAPTISSKSGTNAITKGTENTVHTARKEVTAFHLVKRKSFIESTGIWCRRLTSYSR
jgi:hypothetical protein